MNDRKRTPIVEWIVDYGDGREPVQVTVPHAWRQDVDVSFEGPVIYSTVLDVPRGHSHLHFAGVSYAVEIFIEGEFVARHQGLWDSFDVPLDAYGGRHVALKASVVKNGGSTYPVRKSLSGFLPYVFHTFGGIHGEVDLVEGTPEPAPHPFDVSTRFAVNGSKLFVDGRPFYLRGILSWGWYPDVGHTNPPDETIRAEVRAIRSVGFNLIKFCLWIPSHRYLEIMREEGMEAWIELPLWNPSIDDPEHELSIAAEIERIVRQYRRHENVLAWTIGCELSENICPVFLRNLTQLVQSLTLSPLVKDTSGSAEMYGGDLREFGTFYDFHPYCDTPFYGPVLSSLLPGPRPKMPTLLGEINDIDVHRDIARLGNEMPFWASTLRELNEKGVRWQHDLPEVLADNRFSLHPIRERHGALVESSRTKALFIRKTVQELVRSHEEISGYVITGLRDTPISSAGLFDDFGNLRFSPDECARWNGEAVLFRIPVRRPPWVNGGNRIGILDSSNFFAGQLFWRIGMHSELGMRGGLVWRLESEDGRIVASGAEPVCTVDPLTSTEIGQICLDCTEPGAYRLNVEFGSQSNSWPIWVVPPPSVLAGWGVLDSNGLLAGLDGNGPNLLATERPPNWPDRCIYFAAGEGTNPCPFWREAAYEFKNDDFWHSIPFKRQWSRLMAVSPDRALNPSWLSGLGLGHAEVLLNRIDTRTYEERPVIARLGGSIITTLRPWGGLGDQPSALSANPAGWELIRAMTSWLDRQ